MIISITEEEL